MDPPTYEEARLHPPALSIQALDITPPPSYDVSLSSPSTPPPTYGEAVTLQANPFPVLTPPSVPQISDAIIHPTAQIDVTQPVNGRQRQPAAVVSQPQSSPRCTVTNLKDVPDVVRCPHCLQVVNTEVKHLPGRAVWTLCVLLALMGLICGVCLIPFMVRSLYDVHHYCPQCGNRIHIFTR